MDRIALVFFGSLVGLCALGAGQERVIVETPLKPLKMVQIDYPEVLRKEGVAARVRVFVSISRKGDVKRALMTTCTYPELKEPVLDMVKKWKFEPLMHKGEAMNYYGPIVLIFHPGDLQPSDRNLNSTQTTPEAQAEADSDDELQTLLNTCTHYAERLFKSALLYICRERTIKKTRELKENEIVLGAVGGADLGPGETIATNIKTLELRGGKSYRSSNGYQLARQDKDILELRFPLANDSKSIRENEDQQDGTLDYSLKPILLPIRFFGAEQRRQFHFELLGGKEINGRPAYALEVIPRAEHSGAFKSAKVWVDKLSGRIAVLELRTDFQEGYEEVFEECRELYFKPHFTSTCYYEIDKDGLLYPSRTETRVEYSGLLSTKKSLKSEVTVTYDDYKFFAVETDHGVIKKNKPARFFNPKEAGSTNLIPLSHHLIFRCGR